MPSARVRLFVYGSLRRGERHHDELLAVGATFLGAAETEPGYRLVALGEYQALVTISPHDSHESHLPLALNELKRRTEADVVQGELYDVPKSQLPLLDAFEGDAYMRGTVMLREGEESLAYFKKAR